MAGTDPIPDRSVSAAASSVFAVDAVAEGNEFVVMLRGELDAQTAWRLDEVLDRVLPGGVGVLVFDLTNLRFIDSSGLNRLVTAMKWQGEHDGIAILRRPRPSIMRILEIVGLAGMVPIT